MRVAVAAAVFVCALVTIGECLGQPVGVFDEPLHYVGSMLVARGERVHVDFHSSYPPPNYALLSLTFRLLGETAFAARLLHVVLYLILLGGLASFYRRVGSDPRRVWGSLLGAVVLTASLPWFPSFSAVAFALLAVLAYLHALIAASPGARRGALLVAGALGAFAVLTRLNWGAYVLLVFAFDAVVELARLRHDHYRGWRRLFGDCAALASGAGLSIAVFALTLGRELRTVWHEVVTVPSQALGSYSIPAYAHGTSRVGVLGLLVPLFPTLWLSLRSPLPRARRVCAATTALLVPLVLWLGYTGDHGFALLAFPILLAPLLHQVFARRIERPEFVGLSTVAVFAHYYLNRPDFEHQVPSVAPVALVLPFALASAFATPAARRSWAALLVAFVLAVPALLKEVGQMRTLKTAAAMLLRTTPNGSDAAALAEAPSPMPPYAALYPDADEVAAARFVRARTLPGQAVYVGMADHTRPFVNDVRLYWEIGRRPGARHYMLAAGVTNTPEAEQEIVHDLIERRVRWVVLWKGMSPPPGFVQRNRSGSSLLDDYLARAFRPAATFGAFEVRTAS